MLLAVLFMGTVSAQTEYLVISRDADDSMVFIVSEDESTLTIEGDSFEIIDRDRILNVLTASIPDVSISRTVTVSISDFTQHIDYDRFEYPSENPTEALMHNLLSGGSITVPSLSFTFDRSGSHIFHWNDDNDEDGIVEYQTEIRVTADGDVIFNTPTARVADPRSSALTVPIVVSDTFESYIVAHNLFEGNPHQTRFETGTPGVFTVQVANDVFSGAGNEWEALLIEPAGRRIEIQIPSYGVTMLGNFRSAVNGDSFDSISMDIPAVYTDNPVILSLLQQLEPGVAGVGNTDNPSVILRME